MNRRPRPGIQPETYVAPPTIVPTTKRPNIRPKVRPHSECWNQEWPTFGLLGDVRRCEHGVVQVLTETRSRTIAGPGTHWWRDLRKWLDRREYRAAVAALQALEEGGNDE